MQYIIENISYGKGNDSKESKQNSYKFPIIHKFKYENYEKKNVKGNIIEQKKEYRFNFFGKTFVKYNKHICRLIINNKDSKIINSKLLKCTKNYITIKFILYSHLKNMNSMFERSSLKSISSNFKDNTNNVTNMSHLFNECYKLEFLPDISEWNTNNVTDMSYLFTRCSSLKSLPDISKWNIDKVENMNRLFSYCTKLEKLPDISK